MKGVGGNPVLDAYQRMAITQVGQAAPVRGTAPVATPTGNAEHAEVSISSHARDLASGGKFDADKVEALKTQIAEGKFKIDSQDVARRMLEALG